MNQDAPDPSGSLREALKLLAQAAAILNERPREAWLPEVVPFSIPARCESQRQCKVGSGSFREIRFIAVNERVVPNSEA